MKRRLIELQIGDRIKYNNIELLVSVKLNEKIMFRKPSEIVNCVTMRYFGPDKISERENIDYDNSGYRLVEVVNG